ncbi:hypothetical protein [uncultured Gimesia sp.]|jgi:hypothetical protein|uniref:hypothetical protein n=1 Tax=uncultured Gimesia sp. TaxID=1678688 RepID=UPI00261F7472|nr:hypothetical protein [uncultured Gimesia sp.]
MTENFQRIGSVSNAHVGRDFEDIALNVLADNGISVKKDFPVKVGVGGKSKIHKFDLGSETPAILVECKSHRWTKGSNVPSAKVTVWNEAMYYFHCAPGHYRKIFFVLKDKRASNSETLVSYYIRTYGHLIPLGVEIWEFDEDTGKHIVSYSH